MARDVSIVDVAWLVWHRVCRATKRYPAMVENGHHERLVSPRAFRSNALQVTARFRRRSADCCSSRVLVAAAAATRVAWRGVDFGLDGTAASVFDPDKVLVFALDVTPDALRRMQDHAADELVVRARL